VWIGHHHRHETWLASRACDGAGDAGKALDDRIVGRRLKYRPPRPKARIEQWIRRGLRLLSLAWYEAGAGQRLGSNVAHEHVGLVDQAEQGVEPFGLLDVEPDRALVAIEVDELAGHAWIAAALRHGAQEVATGRLDLDDLGTVVGERARAESVR
jgi:hypothetical protein